MKDSPPPVSSGIPEVQLYGHQGVPAKVVSERLGHASPAFTMSVYQHVLPGMQAEMASVAARLVDS